MPSDFPVARPPALLSTLRKAARFVVPQKKALAAIAAMSIVTSVLLTVEPLVLKMLFDEVSGGRRRAILAGGVGALLSVLALREVLSAKLEEWIWRVRLEVNLLIS